MTGEQTPLTKKQELRRLNTAQVLGVIIIILGALELTYVHKWYGVFGFVVGFGLIAVTAYKKRELQKPVDEYEQSHPPV
jgi:hypothetical protein